MPYFNFNGRFLSSDIPKTYDVEPAAACASQPVASRPTLETLAASAVCLKKRYGVVSLPRLFSGGSLHFPHVAGLVLSALCAARVQAQLRPLQPVDPIVWFDSANVRAHFGAGWLEDQRASLAGTKGRLIELGDVSLLVRTGRVVLEFGGTPQRWLSEESRFALPAGGAHASTADNRRHDSGDYRVATSVRLASTSARVMPVLRFGARLPTTDNMVGLDRDATDFFGLLGGVVRHDRLLASGEAGVGINGTRLPNYEQSDVLLYSLTVQYDGGIVTPMAVLVGQEDLKERVIRGNEDLGEARAGVRIGKSRWLQILGVFGYSTFSPSFGVIVAGGMRFDWK